MANKRGRKPGFKMPEEHRRKIANACVHKALIEHVEGRRDMGSTQVQAAIALMRKVLPDLSTTTLAGDADAPLHARVSVAWEAIDPEKKE